MLSPPDGSCSNSHHSTPYPSDHSESESALSISASGQSFSTSRSPLPSQSSKSSKPKSRKRRLSASAKKTVLILLRKGQETKSARSLLKLAKRRSLSKKHIPSITVLQASQSVPDDVMANLYHDQHRGTVQPNGSYPNHSMMSAPSHKMASNRPYIDDSTDHTFKNNLSADEASSPIATRGPSLNLGTPELQSTRAHSPSWSSRSGPVMGRCPVFPLCPYIHITLIELIAM